MSRYRVVCIDKDDTYHEAAFEDLYNARRFVELLKRLLIFDTTDMFLFVPSGFCIFMKQFML